MERRRFDESASRPPSTPPPQPNYTSRQVQGALIHLASIDPIELSNEAKIEHCRATRDLRSCGRYVQSVLITCGHASLCEECSQRCDVCPICRIPLPKDGNRLHLRLYYECIGAGLISKRCDDRFQDKEASDRKLVPDVLRLYSLFDVALENNLSSLICHYITNVCMDESAVSSDPVFAFLLDEVVVKDWCKQTFRNILSDLQYIYNLTAQEMKGSLNSLLKFSVKLAGISNVLEVLESSFKDSLAAKLHDLQYLQESLLKTKQHMEIMIWCIGHDFLENMRSKYADFASWRSVVRQRKSAAVKRSWPDLINRAADSSMQQSSTLFIEDALLNLETEQGLTDDHGEEYQIDSLQKEGGSSFFRSKIEGMVGCYPFENLRAAVDILFLRGSSDLVVAKQAIFLYYLFDWHWTMPDETWRYIVDDFAATFSISRHALLESLTFYLLDDYTDEALQEACCLLPEVSGPTIHPKVAQVLLERQNPDAALMVLRWSGRDGGQVVSLRDAITAVRVRVECGLLTEAFMYQRMVCMKAKVKKLRGESLENTTDDVKDQSWEWPLWVEALVTEICCLCIRRSLVDRMIELPWNSDEEKHIHKCLLDFAIEDPSTAFGSLLVVFYLQRYWYTKAYHVDQRLQNVEQEFIAKGSAGEEILARMRSTCHWRAGLVGKGIELLPDVLQQNLKTGRLSEEVGSPDSETDVPENSESARGDENILTSFMVPHVDSPCVLRVDSGISSLKPPVPETSWKIGGSSNVSNFNDQNFGASTPFTTLFSDTDKGLKTKSGLSKSFRFIGITTPGKPSVDSPSASPIRSFDKRVPWNSQLQNYQKNKASPERAEDGIVGQFQDSSSYYSKDIGNRLTSPVSDQGILGRLAQDAHLNISTKPPHPQRADRWRKPPLDDQMDISWSNEKQVSLGDVNANGGLRWRSDELSDDEDYENPGGYAGAVYQTRHVRGIRRSRFSMR